MPRRPGPASPAPNPSSCSTLLTWPKALGRPAPSRGSKSARPVALEELEPVDLVVGGCVAVRATGVIPGEELTEEKIAAVPLLERLRSAR